MNFFKTLLLANLIFWGQSLPDCLCGARKKGVKALQIDFFSNEQPEVRLEILKLAINNYNQIARRALGDETILPEVHPIIEGGQYTRRVYRPRSGVPNFMRDIGFETYSYMTMEKYVYRLGRLPFYVYYTSESVNKLGWQLWFSTQELNKDKWDFPDDQAQLAASGPFDKLKGGSHQTHTASFSYTDGNQLAYDVCADFQIFLNKLLKVQFGLATGLTSTQLISHIYKNKRCREDEDSTTLYLPDSTDLLARKGRKVPMESELKSFFKHPRESRLKAKQPTIQVPHKLERLSTAQLNKKPSISNIRELPQKKQSISRLSTTRSDLSLSQPSAFKLMARKQKLQNLQDEPIIEEREEPEPRKMLARKGKNPKNIDEPVVEEREPVNLPPQTQDQVRPLISTTEEYRAKLRSYARNQQTLDVPEQTSGAKQLDQPEFTSKIPVIKQRKAMTKEGNSLMNPKQRLSQSLSGEKLAIGQPELSIQSINESPLQTVDEDAELNIKTSQKESQLATNLRNGFRGGALGANEQHDPLELEFEFETVQLPKENLGTLAEGGNEPGNSNRLQIERQSSLLIDGKDEDELLDTLPKIAHHRLHKLHETGHLGVNTNEEILNANINIDLIDEQPITRIDQFEGVQDLNDLFGTENVKVDSIISGEEESQPLITGFEDVIEDNLRNQEEKKYLQEKQKNAIRKLIQAQNTRQIQEAYLQLQRHAMKDDIKEGQATDILDKDITSIEGNDRKERGAKMLNQKSKSPPTNKDADIEELQIDESAIGLQTGLLEESQHTLTLGDPLGGEELSGLGQEEEVLNVELEESQDSVMSIQKQGQATQKRFIRKPSSNKSNIRSKVVEKQPDVQVDIQLETEKIVQPEVKRIRFSEEERPDNASNPEILTRRKARLDRLDELLSVPAAELFAEFNHEPSEAFYGRMNYDLSLMRQDGLFRPAQFKSMVLWPEGSSIPMEKIVHPGNPDSPDFEGPQGGPKHQEFNRKLKFVKRFISLAELARKDLGGDFMQLKFRIHEDLSIEANHPQLVRELVAMAFLTSPDSYYLKPVTIAKMSETVQEIQRIARIQFLYDDRTRTYVIDDVSDLTGLEESQLDYHKNAVNEKIKATLKDSLENWEIAVLNSDSSVIHRNDLLQTTHNIKRSLI